MQKITRIAAWLLVAVALVLAVLAFALGRRAAHTHASTQAQSAPARAGNAPGQANLAHIVIAARTLPAGQRIAASALRTVATGHAPADSYTSVDAVAGDVPLVDIAPGSVITAALLAHGMATEIRPGERALAVPVDEVSGAGNRIVPGDYVDVFLTLKPAPSYDSHNQEMKQPQTRLLLSRLRVLAYGTRDLPSPRTAGQASGDKKAAAAAATRQPPHTAVLAVPVDEVDRLLLGLQDGKLDLALRNPVDNGEPDPSLFPRPRAVLPSRVRLTATQRQVLGTPENQAYAGIDGMGLAGQALARPVVAHPSVRRAPRIEIIRGTQAHSL